jgi:hypothetical protein
MATKATDKNNIQEISAELGIHYLNLDKAIENIKLGMFYMYYRHDATDEWQVKYNETLKAAYKRWTGSDFDVKFAKTTKVTPVALMGPPGHGKTTAFKEAGKWFAKETGLNYVDRIDIGDYVGTRERPAAKVLPRDTFLFVSQEFSGEVSKAGIGLPFKGVGEVTVGDETVQIEYMRNMMPGRFQLMKKCCASVLLFDDFVNASPAIQNIALSITNENRFQDMDYSNVLIGVTGNLGALDGTNTSRMSSALVSRLEAHIVADSPADFVQRLMARTNDTVGDLGISGFLKNNFSYFWKMPEKGAFPCPRTWDLAIDKMRMLVSKNGNNLKAALEEISNVLPSYVGAEVALHTESYLKRLVDGAEPLARKLIKDGKWSDADLKQINDSYGNGHDTKQQDFAFQLATSLADHAGQDIALHPKHEEVQDLYKKIADREKLTPAEETRLKSTRKEILKELVGRFTKGMARIENAQAFSFGLHQLCDKLTYQVPAWSQESTEDDRKIRKLVGGFKVDMTESLIDLIKEDQKGEKTNIITREHVMTVIDVVSGADRNANHSVAVKKKKSA